VEKKTIQDFAQDKYANVRISVDFSEYDIEKDSRILIPFSYYQHYGLMNRNGEIVQNAQFDRILDSCRSEDDVIRVGVYYTYGFNRKSDKPWTNLNTKWGLLDSLGNIVLGTEYRQIGVSDDKQILTLQHMDYQYEVIHIDGKIVIPKGIYSWIDTYDKGLTRVCIRGENNSKWGIVDANGEIVLPIIYSSIWNFYKKNKIWITIESIDEHQNRRVGRFNLITHKVEI